MLDMECNASNNKKKFNRDEYNEHNIFPRRVYKLKLKFKIT